MPASIDADFFPDLVLFLDFGLACDAWEPSTPGGRSVVQVHHGKAQEEREGAYYGDAN